MQFVKKVGGRKLVGFFACLIVGGVLVYFGRLDSVAASFICALYAAYVGGNAGTHIATAVREFALSKGADTKESDDGG